MCNLEFCNIIFICLVPGGVWCRVHLSGDVLVSGVQTSGNRSGTKPGQKVIGKLDLSSLLRIKILIELRSIVIT